MEKKKIFTIGHSNHTIEYFYELLQSQEINCLIDIRSLPASKFNPQFNQTCLKNYLKNKGITYLHFKNEFGARQEGKEILDEKGQVNFDRFRKTFNFKRGVVRVRIGALKGYKITLMCAEGDPLKCHRFSMVAVYLRGIGFEVKHIMKNKQLKSHHELEKELLERYSKKLSKPSLFKPNIDEKSKLEEAYQLHNKEIGWLTKRKQGDLSDK